MSTREPLDPGDLYQPKFSISRDDRIVTAGSCFAQHVGRTLKTSGYFVVDTEPFPGAGSDALARSYGYRLYSARYGNIYTVRQLMQLLDEVDGVFVPEDAVWEKDGRHYDAFRPNVEPAGLPSPDDVRAHRKQHLNAVRRAFNQADLFVFTFGLTEAWTHRQTGQVYPLVPGAIAGQFDPEKYAFTNYEYPEILSDFEAFRNRMKERRPDIRFMVTTSPVPLTATASNKHVEVATCYSKATLRAVCGTLEGKYDDVDYFPSYEVITSTNNRGVYFEANKRSVSNRGVETAMALFRKSHGATDPDPAVKADDVSNAETPEAKTNDDVVCEEQLLEAFAK